VRAYKTHLAVANRYSAAPGSQSRGSFRGLAAFFGRSGSRKTPAGATTTTEPMAEAGAAAGLGKLVRSSAERRGRTHRRDESTSTADSFAWVPGKAVEPRLLFDDPTPDSGYSSTPFHGAGSSSKVTPTSEPTPGSGSGSGQRPPIRRSHSAGSSSSTEGLLDGQEPSFFSVVMGPRRALRVVNGLEGEDGVQRGNSGRSEKSARQGNSGSQYQ
jgi:hypothetical protein